MSTRTRLFPPTGDYDDAQIREREGPDEPTEDEQRLAADDLREHLIAVDEERYPENLTLTITMKSASVDSIADELESVARQIRGGCVAGNGSRYVQHLEFRLENKP